MLYGYLCANYTPNEPIFISDIKLPDMAPNNIRQQFKVLCDSGRIKRYDTGIYYIPKKSRLKNSCTLSPSLVAQYKFISKDNNIIDGYYSGYTFANQLGISTQVPQVMEISTNGATTRHREIEIRGQRIILRKPIATVTKDNYKILQVLDLLKGIDEYIDGTVGNFQQIIKEYIRSIGGISRIEIAPYISKLPKNVYKAFYDLDLYELIH